MKGKTRPLGVDLLSFLSVVALVLQIPDLITGFISSTDGLSAAPTASSGAAIIAFNIVVPVATFAFNVVCLVFMLKANRRYYILMIVGLGLDVAGVAILLFAGQSVTAALGSLLIFYGVRFSYFYFSRAASAYFGVAHKHWFTPVDTPVSLPPAGAIVSSPAPQDTPDAPLAPSPRVKDKVRAASNFTLVQITSAVQTLLTIRDMGDEYNGDYKKLVQSDGDIPPIIALLMQASLSISGPKSKDELLALLRGYLPSIGLDDRHYMQIVDGYEKLDSLYRRLKPAEYDRKRELVNATAKQLANKGPDVNYELKTFCEQYVALYCEELDRQKAAAQQGKSVTLRRWQLAALVAAFVLAVGGAGALLYMQHSEIAAQKVLLADTELQLKDANLTIGQLRSRARERENVLAEYEEQYDELYDITLAAANKADFMDRNIALVASLDGNGYYHTMDCGLRAARFYVYTVDEAAYRGYKPCQSCH